MVFPDEDCLEDNVSLCKTNLQNRLISEEFRTRHHKLGLEPLPIRNFEYRISIVYPNSAPVVNYALNGDIILCFGSFASDWVDIAHVYVEQA